MRDRHDDPSAQDPLPGLSGVGRSKPSELAPGAAEVDAAAATAGVDATAGATAAGATTEVGAAGAVRADPIAAITDALATGAIDPDTARSRLIDAVVAAQMPAGADPAVWQEIRADVEALLAGDPTLMDLLRT